MTRKETTEQLVKMVTMPALRTAIENSPQIKNAESHIGAVAAEIMSTMLIASTTEAWEEIFEHDDLDKLIEFYQSDLGKKSIQASIRTIELSTAKTEAIIGLAEAFKAME